MTTRSAPAAHESTVTTKSFFFTMVAVVVIGAAVAALVDDVDFGLLAVAQQAGGSAAQVWRVVGACGATCCLRETACPR